MSQTSTPSDRTVQPAPFRFAARAAGLRQSAIREILKSCPGSISFAGGLPAPELFPVSEFSRAAGEILEEAGPASLQYDVTEGHPPLREWVCGHLRGTAGIVASPEDILILNGSQQGLDLVAKVLLDPGDTVLVENPSYLGALQAFRAYEGRPVGLPCDEEGIRPDALRAALGSGWRRPKLIYLVPNFHNPTGTTMSARRRREVADIAARAGVPFLEDDPYGQLRYRGEAIPAIASLRESADSLYLGTTSKILSPGMRVAWLVVRDPGLRERLVAAKQSTDLHTSSFAQRLVCRVVTRPGLLETHVERLRSAYARRRDAMLSWLGERMPECCAWTQPEGGIFIWVALPEPLDTAALLQACMPRGITFVPGAPFWVDLPVRTTMRLNFSNATEGRIAEGIGRLGRAVAEAMS
jgi:2-aminoadipate transaminase